MGKILTAVMGREETMIMTHGMTLTTVTITDVLLKNERENQILLKNKVSSGLKDPRDNDSEIPSALCQRKP